MISASGEVGVSVMMEFCQRLLHGKGMPDEWQTSALVTYQFSRKREMKETVVLTEE